MIRTVHGKGAQEAEEVFRGEQFNFIDAFAAMDTLLAPGGMLLRKIDLRDYGMFFARGVHPREYSTVPDWIYGLVASRIADSTTTIGIK